MKVAIIGTRGIPVKYGEYETFAEEISPFFVELGFQTTVYCDKAIEKQPIKQLKGVMLQYQKTTKTKHSLLFYFDGLLMALK